MICNTLLLRQQHLESCTGLRAHYIRSELRWSAHTRLADVGALRGGGQVVVELLERDDARRQRAGSKAKEKAKASSAQSKAGLAKVGGGAGAAAGAEEEEEDKEDSDDGYATEESE